MARRITPEEINKYWEIFATLSNGAKHLTGEQAASVLKNSRLSDDKLAAIWDLADIDSDGMLDFEEFCVAMRIIFDLVNGEISRVPETIPSFLVPESKAHLVAASNAIGGKEDELERFESLGLGDEGLQDGFDWYMSPHDKGRYQTIYDANADRHGQITFDSLNGLYSSLDVPDSEVRRAWKLVNHQNNESINKDAALVFLHILNQRHNGFRIPTSVPASLRSSFENNQIDYNVSKPRGKVSMYDEIEKPQARTYTSKKEAFGEGYLSRLGIGGRGNYAPAGTDFSQSKEEDWEEVRLKRQLAELEKKVEAAQAAAAKRRGEHDANSGISRTKQQLEELLDYKRKELRDMDNLRNLASGPDTNTIKEELESLKGQVQGLEDHLRKREQVLEDLKAQIDNEKSR
ncbi:EF-hand [Ascobolus immersus RN42]|uniref:Endocytosis protein 3 n=1 Tax=Ascobolus immersus RN42 TaxID=1160509 RepID=A0A3N4IUY0_ASCIM|nr:EF-hand [Ascobolus immersus RN42]